MSAKKKAAKKKVAKKAAKKPKSKLATAPEMVTCPDCEEQQKADSPINHAMFCEARTCEKCLSTFTHVVQRDASGQRVCEECQGGADMDEDSLDESEDVSGEDDIND